MVSVPDIFAMKKLKFLENAEHEILRIFSFLEWSDRQPQSFIFEAVFFCPPDKGLLLIYGNFQPSLQLILIY